MTDSLNLTADSLTEAPLVFSKPSATQLAVNDLLDGLKKWRIWSTLAYQDIKIRYRRSVLGPLWITLSMAITVYSMGYLYSHLFHSDLLTYFPFVVTGMLGWSLISTVTIDTVDTFTALDRMIKQIKLPYSLYIHRIVTKNFLIFFHNLLVLVPIYVFFHNTATINLNTLLLIPNLILLYFNAISFGLILAMLGGRYRDISQMVRSLIQVVFFVTPVMWSPSILGPNKLVFILCNPFYSMIELVRAPMLGQLPTSANYLIVFSMTIIGSIISFKMFRRYRARIVYWI